MSVVIALALILLVMNLIFFRGSDSKRSVSDFPKIRQVHFYCEGRLTHLMNQLALIFKPIYLS
jgi:hypothetical protein